MNSQPNEERAPQKTAGALRRLAYFFLGPATWANARSWAFILVLVFAIRWAGIDQFVIPSGSMEPTLHGDPGFFRGDRVSVNKWIYGLRFPFDEMRVPFTKHVIRYAGARIFRGAEPQRWDIVVFRSTEADSAGETLIKRVVGLPGERVHIEDGKIFINGAPVEPPEELRGILHYTTVPTDKVVRTAILQLAQSGRYTKVLNSRDLAQRRLMEELAALREKILGRELASISDAEAQTLTSTFAASSMDVMRLLVDEEYARMGLMRYGVRTDDEYSLVPLDHYLLLGDNSEESRDGRAFGWVPNANILGRAFAIWWPIPRWRDFTGFSDTWWGMLLLYGIPVVFFLYEPGKHLLRRLKRSASS